MKFLAIIYNDESQYADATPEDIAATFQAHGEFGEAAGKAGVFARRRRPAADRDRDHGARARRRADAHRRPVRRDQGAARRLLPARVQGPRRRAQLGGADPGGQDRRGRGAAGHGLRGDAAAEASPQTVLVDRLFRRESGQAVAVLARILGDLDRAEEAVQDAFLIALERWPRARAAGQPGGLDRHRGAQPRARPDPLRAPLGGPARRARGRAARARRRRGRRGARAREPDPRRAAAADLHDLPPGARRRGARRR